MSLSIVDTRPHVFQEPRPRYGWCVRKVYNPQYAPRIHIAHAYLGEVKHGPHIVPVAVLSQFNQVGHGGASFSEGQAFLGRIPGHLRTGPSQNKKHNMISSTKTNTTLDESKKQNRQERGGLGLRKRIFVWYIWRGQRGGDWMIEKRDTQRRGKKYTRVTGGRGMGGKGGGHEP